MTTLRRHAPLHVPQAIAGVAIVRLAILQSRQRRVPPLVDNWSCTRRCCRRFLKVYIEQAIGRLIVFHFAPHNPTRAYMEWFANWYLTYRDLGTLRQVTDAAGISGASIEYGSESLGIDLYVQITLNS